MDPIPVSCRTNLDDYKREQWPVEMVVRPIVGDRIESKSGKVLKIVSITHAIREEKDVNHFVILHPILIVDLNR